MLRKKIPVLHDKWFRFIGIPLIALMGHITFFNRNNSGEEIYSFWEIYFISLAETCIVWESIRMVIIYFRKKYPGIEYSKKRIIKMLVYCTLLTIIIRTIIIVLYNKTQFWGYAFPLEGYLYNVFVAVLYVLIVGSIYEGIYYFNSWKAAAVEAEALRNENLQTQLDSLKAQINPHFLFNSLSSLNSLIAEEPRKAEKFVTELSSVYRYLLQSNEKELTTLEKELEFITAYVHLLKTRFQEGFEVEVNITPSEMHYLLPPLTLQLLIENAIKHNIILPDKPLLVHIYLEDGKLIAKNNLQKKNVQKLSNKMGLKNISAKYKLMKLQDILIEQTAEYFIVAVPLIKTEDYAYIDNRR